jgi:hypothetical protein
MFLIIVLAFLFSLVARAVAQQTFRGKSYTGWDWYVISDGSYSHVERLPLFGNSSFIIPFVIDSHYSSQII